MLRERGHPEGVAGSVGGGKGDLEDCLCEALFCMGLCLLGPPVTCQWDEVAEVLDRVPRVCAQYSVRGGPEVEPWRVAA